MRKVYYIIIISIIPFLFSCNNNNKRDNSKNEINLKLDDIEGEWVHAVDISKTGEPDGTEYYLYLYVKTNTVRYYPCYDDCVYEGTYKYKGDKVYIECSDISDNADPINTSKLNITFTYKDGKLISEDEEEYIRISDKVAFEEIEKDEEINIERQEFIQETDTLKPTMYEVVKILNNHLFIGKKNDYYFTYNFTYTVLDEYDNAMFWCEYEEFVLNNNYGTTQQEILRQSANSATFITSKKLMVSVMKDNLNDNSIVVKRNRAHDIMPRFEFRISKIKRDSEGNLTNAQINADALGVALGIKPKQ